MTLQQTASEYLNAGLSIVPVNGDKRPIIDEWASRQKTLPSLQTVNTDFAGNNRLLAVIGGVVSGNLEFIDFDAKGECYGPWAEIIEQQAPGLLNRLVVERSPSGGYHVTYRCKEPVSGNSKLAAKGIEVQGAGDHEYLGKKLRARKVNGKYFIIPDMIETRGEGGYCVTAPSQDYKLIQGDYRSLPVITGEERQIIIYAARSLNQWVPPESIISGSTSKQRQGSGTLPGDDYNQTADPWPILEKHGWKKSGRTGNVNGETAEYLCRPGKDRGRSASLIGGKVLYNFSANGYPFEPDKAYSPFAIFTLLEHSGDFQQAARELSRQGYGEKHTFEQPNYHQTDLGNAERLVNLHGKDLRYCHPFRRWYIWNGKQWTEDDSGELKRKAKDAIRSMYADAGKIEDEKGRKEAAKFALRCESDQKINAMLSLAQSEPDIPVMPGKFNTDPYLFNCLNGTINLRTGELQPHTRKDLISKLSPFNYDPDAQCPVWFEHLDKITAGNKNLISYLQKSYGYSMTGDTSERKLFVAWGGGANGKSVTNDTIACALGDYSMRTPTETLLVKHNDGIPNDVARLMNARMVYAAESESGRSLAESRIKDMTGGEKITARYMRGEWFEFYPEFKIWLGTNHKPIIRGTDQAIWDRIRLIPFAVRIPESEQIPKSELLERFKEEMPGILAWLVRGCLAWQKEGLGSPSEIMDATSEYRSEMDALASFIEDRCDIGSAKEVSAKDLYAEYEKWANDNGERTISKKLFGLKMAEKGFDAYRASRGVRKWVGVGVTCDVL